jgi:hypothetical protein
MTSFQLEMIFLSNSPRRKRDNAQPYELSLSLSLSKDRYGDINQKNSPQTCIYISLFAKEALGGQYSPPKH